MIKQWGRLRGKKEKSLTVKRKLSLQYPTPLNGRPTVRNDKCAHHLGPPWTERGSRGEMKQEN